jgi:predicted phage tail component-like protein
MIDTLTNGFTIEVNGTTYHSKTDFGLAISNTNYIGEPEQETSFVSFPTVSGFYDTSELLSKEPVFKSRTINIEVGAINPRLSWDSVMSDIRNKLHGRLAKIIFDNDPEWYWQGRVSIANFDRKRQLGTFNITMYADPFKYAVTPIIDTYTASGEIALPASEYSIIPEFYFTANSETSSGSLIYNDRWGFQHQRDFDETDDGSYVGWFKISLFNSFCTSPELTLNDAEMKVRWRAKSL